MNISQSNKNFLLAVFQQVPPSHLTIFLRLIRLYPLNIVKDRMKREQAILAIVNETVGTDYKNDIWPTISAINRIPELVDLIFVNEVNDRLILAIEKMKNQFELQLHRFKIYQLVPTMKLCITCQKPLQEPKFDEICQIISHDNVYHCAMYQSECCGMIFRYGHVRNPRTRERFISIDAIFKQKYVHFFDHFIFERSMLTQFTNLIHEAASSFQSYTNAINASIDQNRNFSDEEPSKFELNSKFFGVTWLWFEICRYLFFMTDLSIVQIPDVIQRSSHNMYFEANNDLFYELFVKFWSRHNQVQQCRCRKKESCMLNFVFDTHMKAHRLVCAFTGSCDESVPEMGPVAIGCPRSPLRSSSKLLKNMTPSIRSSCKHYCFKHVKYGMIPDGPKNAVADEAMRLDLIAAQFEENDPCSVHRDEDDTEHKRRTAGFMAMVSNCNIIIGWNESVRAEGMRRNTYQLLRYMHLGGILPPAVAYDSACTFLAYLKAQYSLSITPSPFVDQLMKKNYSIDRFHRRNHTRPECKTTLSCSHENNRPFFDQQNTQVCEQLFAHFTKLKATLRSLSWPYSTMFYCLIFHLRNCFETKIFPDNPHLSIKSDIPMANRQLVQWTQIMASNSSQLEQQDPDDGDDTDDPDNIFDEND